MEEVDTISVAVAGIDINNVVSLDSRRLVAFINHYVTTTVSFLNHFSTLCETRLEKMHYQLLKLEQRLTLLECKLSSGSAGLQTTENVETKMTTSNTRTETRDTSAATQEMATENPENSVESRESSEAQPESNRSVVDTQDGHLSTECLSLKDDPKYAKYYKMAAVGVPIQAVKLKMIADQVSAEIISK